LHLLAIMKRNLLPLILAAAAAPAAAQEATLKTGDPAPALDVEHWLKGEAVTAFEPGQCYVVEFWATWCPPCKASMPHLSELQEEYGDQLVVIGLSDEPLEVAKSFLDQPEWAAKTRYTLGTDPDRSVYADYMDAAKQRGIPTSFLVNGEGKIVWIGHPSAMDRPLRKMLGVEASGAEAAGETAEMDAAFQAMLDQEWESTAAAEAWLDKAGAALRAEDQRFSFTQSTTVKGGSPDGEMIELPLTRTGTVERAGALGTRVDSVNRMDIPMMPEPMEQTGVVVLRDGLWLVEKEPMMPMEPTELKSMTVAEGEELEAEGAGMPTPPSVAPFFDPHPVHADPAATFERLRGLCALDVAEETESQVVLAGEASPILNLGDPEGDGPVTTTLRLVIDRATGRPVELVIGDPEEPEFRMSFSDFAALDAPDPARFDLNPDGEVLPNLAEAIRDEIEMMRSMAGGGGGFEEDEF